MTTLFFAHANGFPSPCYSPFFKVLEQKGFTIDYLEKIGMNPHYPITNNWQYLIDELAAEIKSRHNQPVIGIGHSAGGMLNYLLARKYPELLSHVILLDPPVINGWQNIIWWLSKKLNLSDRLTPAGISKNRRTRFDDRQHAYDHLHHKPLFKKFTEASFKAYLDHALVETESGELTLKIPLETELALYRTAPDNLWQYRSKLNMPGLYLVGEDSKFAQQPFAKRLSKQAEMTYQEVKGGHLFPQENPEKTAEIIANWIKN